MCLKINKIYHPDLKAKIAQKDIYTLKVSKYCDTNNRPKSYFRYTLQNYNTILQSDLIYNIIRDDAINNGLHSLISGITNTMSGDNFDESGFLKIIILCRIPKGSKYFIGDDNDIVSNQLELIQPIIGNDKYCNYIKLNNSYIKHDFITKKLWNTCIKHCEKAGYKIGL